MLTSWVIEGFFREMSVRMERLANLEALEKATIASFIEHTALKPQTTRLDIERLCREARDHNFGGVCFAPGWVPLARELIAVSDVRIVTVSGFPHGDTLPSAKAAEARDSVRAGADDIDMVMQVGRLISGEVDFVRDDIRAVVETAKSEGAASIKVILEIGYLLDDQIRLACQLAEEAGADFVKTSTGFGPGGATTQAVELMHRAVGGRLQIKAAGGIRDAKSAIAMIEAGATRLGCSSSVEIMRELSQ